MEKLEVEIFSRAVNSPVMRMPGRNYPGVLIQGDSLTILYGLAEEVVKLCKASGLEEVGEDEEDGPIEIALELKNNLARYLRHYQEVLKRHNMEWGGPTINLPSQEAIDD